MTKRSDILKAIRRHAKAIDEEVRVVEGGNHTRVWIGDRYTTIGRHREIPDLAARKIYRQLGMEE